MAAETGEPGPEPPPSRPAAAALGGPEPSGPAARSRTLAAWLGAIPPAIQALSLLSLVAFVGEIGLWINLHWLPLTHAAWRFFVETPLRIHIDDQHKDYLTALAFFVPSFAAALWRPDPAVHRHPFRTLLAAVAAFGLAYLITRPTMERAAVLLYGTIVRFFSFYSYLAMNAYYAITLIFLFAFYMFSIILVIQLVIGHPLRPSRAKVSGRPPLWTVAFPILSVLMSIPIALDIRTLVVTGRFSLAHHTAIYGKVLYFLLAALLALVVYGLVRKARGEAAGGQAVAVRPPVRARRQSRLLDALPAALFYGAFLAVAAYFAAAEVGFLEAVLSLAIVLVILTILWRTPNRIYRIYVVALMLIVGGVAISLAKTLLAAVNALQG